jgi:hypothetical protein
MLNALPAGAPSAAVDATLPASYREFLTLADGATCGDVTIFGSATVDSMQFHADPIAGAAVPLGRERWFCPGVISDEPFFINRSTEAVWYFPDTGVEWWMSPTFEKAADDFATFFLEWVTGPQYLRLSATGPEDQWAELLSHTDRVRSTDS